MGGGGRWTKTHSQIFTYKHLALQHFLADVLSSFFPPNFYLFFWWHNIFSLRSVLRDDDPSRRVADRNATYYSSPHPSLFPVRIALDTRLKFQSGSCSQGSSGHSVVWLGRGGRGRRAGRRQNKWGSQAGNVGVGEERKQVCQNIKEGS